MADTTEDERIIIGNDHGGYQAKAALVPHLQERGYEVTDIGCESEDIVRYPHYARKVWGVVARAEYRGGILICSTGIGMSIAANKIKGVRASMCTSHYMAKMTRQHNNSNVLCLGGKITGVYEILDIADAWLDNDYIGGRHDISLGIIAETEEELGLQVPNGEDDDA